MIVVAKTRNGRRNRERKPTEMVKTRWSDYPLRVCLQAVCFEKLMGTVRDTPTLGMETSNGP